MLTHTQKRLLLEAYKNGVQPLGMSRYAWENLEKEGLVVIHVHQSRRWVELTSEGQDVCKSIERDHEAEEAKQAREAQRQADFERRFAAKRVDA